MKKIINHAINVVSVLVLLFFAIPKILGLPKSVDGFTQFESVLGIDATFFRIFTGISELVLAILILIFALRNNKIIGKFAYLFLLVMMLTALAIEFFVRVQPEILLVVIAVILSLFSIYKLKSIKNHE